MKILAIEDNKANNVIYKDILSSLLGYEVIINEDGENLLETLNKERPNLIIMDLSLPKVSGLELIKKIRSNSNHKHIPIIAVSALLSSEISETVLNLGCQAYMEKPFDIKKLIEIVRKWEKIKL